MTSQVTYLQARKSQPVIGPSWARSFCPDSETSAGSPAKSFIERHGDTCEQLPHLRDGKSTYPNMKAWHSIATILQVLLLNDSYLPGALVLAHSLRDAGTTQKLAVFITLDSVSAEAIALLKTVFDHVFPVPRIRNEQPANLYLMNRADLHSAFTKINLWKQTQFTKIVYIDADIVAYRAPDELFHIPHAFSAAPDIGWPDIFNTGVMVITPNMGDYYAMLAMAERNISFDGADQGLLNMHFGRGFNRLPFTYNVTPSAHYQYVPAYRHFQSSISMVHFIGSSKPWLSDRNASHGATLYDEMVGRWWAVYDRHYRFLEASSQQPQTSPVDFLSSFIRRAFQSGAIVTKESHNGIIINGHDSAAAKDETSSHQAPESSKSDGTAHPWNHWPHDFSAYTLYALAGIEIEAQSSPSTGDRCSAEVENVQEPMFTPSWDAQRVWTDRQSPPPGSKPEAANFPATHYEMSTDTEPFIPPARYPSPPRNMWYEVPKEAALLPTKQPRQIFPWEVDRPKPSRAFANERPVVVPIEQESSSNLAGPSQSQEDEQLSPMSTDMAASFNYGNSFPRVNAWDDVPEIDRYVERFRRHHRVGSQQAVGGFSGPLSPIAADLASKKLPSTKVTDFPSAEERPSLPVTPAPIQPALWTQGVTGDHDNRGNIPLPEAEGVPVQTAWDPAEQLQKLAMQQSEALLRRLGGDESQRNREIPSRPLPFGSDPITSPTHVVWAAPPAVLSPQPVSSVKNLVQNMNKADEFVIVGAEATLSGARLKRRGSPAPTSEDAKA
ncbi:glycogenin [Drechmeria coniospora]|uniref:glycogenin glucosyltransferase n=1 Tax=Drechmeria coniospora TaxID=98403 RepID=A0A151GR96_DRECN|nr:glycogenin [Drechmeria coniospora]KYK59637.1 glycogenin [Drechmeria coniospora]